MKVNIRQITFGHSSAEREEQELNNYFLSTRAYLNAKKENSRKLFYVGHRGSGKSALFTQLISDYAEDKSSIILDVNPKDFSYEVFKKMEHSFHNIKTTYAIAWEFTLLIQMMVEVSTYFNKNSNIKKNRENAKIITDYLVKYNYLGESRSLKIFFEYLRKMVDAKVNIKFNAFEAGASIKAGTESEKKLISLLNIEEITLPKRALKELLVTHPAYIFLDELDTGWDNSDEAKNYINGLFDAVYSLCSINNFNVFVSLRQDMYNNLIESLTNAEKIREDIETLHWDKENLKAVIGKRILATFPESETENISYNEAINSVFEQGTLDYIIEHTLKRPREIIAFCNKAQEEYIHRYTQHYDSSRKIDINIVNSILPNFSLSRITDICKEYQFEYPHIKEVLYAFENNFEFWNSKDFLSNLETGVLKLMNKHGEPEWLKIIDFNPLSVMEVLYKIGFIKVFVPSDEKYYASYETNILDISSYEKVKINDVFVSSLKCKREQTNQ